MKRIDNFIGKFNKIYIWFFCFMVFFLLATYIAAEIFIEERPEFALDRISVSIKQEFQQEFEEETFTIEDFEWNNIASISYVTWFNNAPEPYGYMVIYLKEPGKSKVLNAIEHFKTLNFVRDAHPVFIGTYFAEIS